MKEWIQSRAVRLPFACALVLAVGLMLSTSGADIVGGLGTLEELGRFGPFGDLMGGLLNPIVSAAALWWLVKGVLLQRKEVQSAEADQKRQTQMAALTAVIDALNSDGLAILENLRRVSDQEWSKPAQGVRDATGRFVPLNKVEELKATMVAAFEAKQGERELLVQRLRGMLHSEDKASTRKPYVVTEPGSEPASRHVAATVRISEPAKLNEQRLTETFKSLITISLEAFKYLALVNGGGVVALLSFAGNLASKGLVVPTLPTTIAAGSMLLGLALCGVAMLSAYKTQLRLWQEGVGKADPNGRPHPWFLNAAIASAGTSILLFALGSGFGVWACIHPQRL